MSNYRTSDLYLSAYLRSRGLRLLNTENDHGKVTFIFEGEAADSLLSEFYNDTAIPVLTFTSNLKALKGLCKNSPFKI